MNHIQEVRKSSNNEVPIQSNFKVSRKSSGSILKRRESVMFPSAMSSYAVGVNSPTMRIDINSSEALVDPASVFLSFKLTVTGDADANHPNMFLSHADNLFRNIRLYAKKNRTLLEELNEYNRYSSIVRAVSQDDSYSKTIDTFRSKEYDVTPSLADGNAAATVWTGNALKVDVSNNSIVAGAADIDYTFCIKLAHVGLFNPKNKYIPLSQLGNTLHLEIDLEPAATCFSSNGATATGGTMAYTLSDVNIISDLLYMNEAYTRSVMNNKNDMIYNFSSYTFTQSVADTQNGFYNLNFSHSDIKSLLMTQALSSEQSTLTVDYVNKHAYALLSAFSVKSNGVQHPIFDLSTVEQQGNFLFKALGRHCQNSSTSLTLAKYKQDKYIQGLDLEKDQTSFYSGINTVGNPLVAKCNFAAAVPANTVLHWFALHSRAFIVSKGQLFVES